MTWDQIKGDWQQLSAKLKEKWTALTDADLVSIAGRRELVIGLLQQRYHYRKDQAETELDTFIRRLTS